MLLLDITVVNVALPEIERDLQASFSDLQWVVDAYSLMLAALLLTGGSLSDLLGRRLIFVAGLAIFTAASLLCALATTPDFLNVARALQGIGGAFMFATSLALIANAYGGKDRGTAIGIWGATIGAAAAIGPLVGGVLVEAFGWESIFFVNIPIGLLAIVFTLRTVEESKNPQGARIDWPGLVTFSGALFLLVFALIRGNDKGWGSAQIDGMLIAAAVLMAAFVAIEHRRGDRAMLDLKLFRVPSFVGVSIAAFALSASMFAMFLYLTLYIQNILGLSPLQAGLRFLPVTVLSFLVAPWAGKLAERIGIRYFLAGGLTFVGVGLILCGGLNRGDEWTALLVGFMISGIGVGLVNPALATGAIGVVEPMRAGMASGINSTFRQVGIATGIAAYGAIFSHVVAAKAPVPFFGGQQVIPKSEVADFIAFGAYKKLGPQVEDAARDAFLAGFNDIILYAGLLAIAGGVLSLLLVRASDFVAHTRQH
jgi:EmrB/QacA subfamily drug resistance transporter